MGKQLNLKNNKKKDEDKDNDKGSPKLNNTETNKKGPVKKNITKKKNTSEKEVVIQSNGCCTQSNTNRLPAKKVHFQISKMVPSKVNQKVDVKNTKINVYNEKDKIVLSKVAVGYSDKEDSANEEIDILQLYRNKFDEYIERELHFNNYSNGSCSEMEIDSCVTDHLDKCNLLIGNQTNDKSKITDVKPKPCNLKNFKKVIIDWNSISESNSSDMELHTVKKNDEIINEDIESKSGNRVDEKALNHEENKIVKEDIKNKDKTEIIKRSPEKKHKFDYVLDVIQYYRRSREKRKEQEKKLKELEKKKKKVLEEKKKKALEEKKKKEQKKSKR